MTSLKLYLRHLINKGDTMQTLGFTFDEKILRDYELTSFFDEFPQVDALELAPDMSLLPLSTYKKIVTYVKSHHFHVPYFVQSSSFDFASDHYQKDFHKLLSIIESLRQYSVKTPSIIVHGAHVTSSRKLALEQSKYGIDFLLNFIEKKHLDINIRLETIPSTGIGSVQEIMTLYHLFSHERLKACLDIHHSKGKQEMITDDFLSIVDYLHVHDHHHSITNLTDHWYQSIDAHLNLELLYDFCDNYRQSLKDDIKLLRTI